ncbi:hypothetical protein CJ030_MR3G001106 [Morella rubra]|uniref:Uncharacterized protein n=1 Tax=Morella rubra TaxID=262757 RepID=A0A6A1W2I0_9ROSI|nr:hypothetical protein CJ030_MR3G001106 [Morella rubra]
MSKHHRSSSSSFAETSTQQRTESSKDYMTREEQLEQQWVEILSRSVIVEREVSVVDFEEMKRGDLLVVTRHPNGIYKAAEADWSILCSGDGKQARCERNLPHFHRPEHGARWTLSQTEVHAPFLAYSALHFRLRHQAEGSHDRVSYFERRADVVRGKWMCCSSSPQQQVEEPPRSVHQERLAWADAWMANLKGMVEIAISPTHQLFVNLRTRVSSMETQMMGLQPFLTTTPGTLRVMSRRLGAIEDQLEKMSKSMGEGSSQPRPQHD